jgi:hypothetical protein
MRYRSLFCALACFALAVAGTPGQAQNEAPEPAPTNAAQSLESRVSVEGYGHLPLNDTEAARREAYQAAVLDAYQQLFWQGAEHLGLLPPEMSLDSRSFRVDDQHPNAVLMGWLLRAEPVSQEVSGNRLRVTLQSPPLGELASDFPHYLRTLKQDVDGDPVLETIGVTYDGRVQVLKPNGNGFQVLATSPSLNVFACNVLKTAQKESWEQVQLSRVLSVGSLEPLGGGRLRAVAELALGESVDERWVGKASEQREVLLRWDEPKPEPSIEVTEPADFLYTTKPQVAWKGLLRAPAGLSAAKLRVNGRPFWQTPDQLAAQRLRMDILLPLLPGVNRAQVAVTDQSRRTVSREVLLFRDAPSPGLQTKHRRALLIGVPEYQGTQFPRLPRVQQDLERMRAFLQRPDGGGVPAAQITTLSGKTATRQKVLETLRQLSKPEGEERVFLLVYFGGLSSGGASGSGKALLPYDARGFDEGAISTADLLAATGELRQQDLVLLADTSRGTLAGGAPDQLWLDSQEFAENLGRQGWAVLSSVDGPAEQRDSENGSRLLSAFLEGCGAAADGNGDGYIEWDEAYRHTFQTLRVSSPGSAAPLRRGELLGRVPLSAVPRRTP